MQPAKPFNVVVLSGGSAANTFARALESAPSIRMTHVVSVFDNGGSTGHLRRATGLPAMGDLRNRLCAIASTDTPHSHTLRDLFAFRLSGRKSQNQLRSEMLCFLGGHHPITRRLQSDIRDDVTGAMQSGWNALPEDFPLTDLSIGNLIIVGECHRRAGDFLSAVEWARGLMRVKSQVMPVTLSSLHLGAELDTGHKIIGQEELTREGSRHKRRIARLVFLARDDSYSTIVLSPTVTPAVLSAIAEADVIVLGFGSFYSSVLPHLLVPEVVKAVCNRKAPLVWLCNPTPDRETEGLTLADMATILRRTSASTSADAHEVRPTYVVHFAQDQGLVFELGDTNELVSNGSRIVSKSGVAFEDTGRVASDVLLALMERRSHRPTRFRSVALFDLDHTLFDYSALRREATVGAVRTFCDTPTRTVDRLLTALVPPTTDLLQELGLPNLRRQWNTREIYGLAQLFDREASGNELEQAFAVLRSSVEEPSTSSPFARRRQIRRTARALAPLPEVSGVLAGLEKALASDATGFSKQRLAFEDVVDRYGAPVPGGPELLSNLRALGVEVCVVTEGDSEIQLFKTAKLRLDALVDAVVVTDATLGIGSLLEEVFGYWADREDIPPVVEFGYDALEGFIVKAPPFYVKLIHAIAEEDFGAVPNRMASMKFLSPEAWGECQGFGLVMVGDSYVKDMAPLLTVCDRGLTTYRILNGKYSHEDPLHEVIARRAPAPTAYFSRFSDVATAVLAWAKCDNEIVERPEPIFPSMSTLKALRDLTPSLSEAAMAVLDDCLCASAK